MLYLRVYFRIFAVKSTIVEWVAKTSRNSSSCGSMLTRSTYPKKIKPLQLPKSGYGQNHKIAKAQINSKTTRLEHLARSIYSHEGN
jgi:hypothetical protein